MQKFSDASIRSLPAGYHWDGVLGLRVSPKGTRTFLTMLGSGRRHTIGRYGVITLKQAREAATKLQAEKTLGNLPRAFQRRRGA